MNKKVIIVPHVGVYGGAGIYIRNLAESLSEFSPVFSGAHASCYGEKINLSKHLSIDKIYFPNYAGVKILTKLIVLFISFIRLLYVFFMRKDRIDKKNKNVIILTSGIQLLVFFYFKRKYPNAHFILFVQENWLLNNFLLGSISRTLLSRVDLVVSITDSWKSYASTFGVESYILKNVFSESIIPISVRKPKYDLLYFGGTQKIKGYGTLIEFVQEYSKKSKIVVAMLGGISNKEKLEIEKINESLQNDSRILPLGFISDTTPIIDESKIIFLPITDSHFCRPAIEAGLRRKTFIIRDLGSLSDFAIAEKNCTTFTTIKDLTKKYNRLTMDSIYLKKLSSNNYNFSIKFIKRQAENIFFYNYIEKRVKL